MEKIFTPNRIFVYFCAALIVIWACLQIVSNQLLSAIAEQDGKAILNWSWPGANLSANVDSIHAEVTSRTATDAIVKVSGKQTIRHMFAGAEISNPVGQEIGQGVNKGASKELGEPTECDVTLGYYHNDKHWILGRVELP